MIYANQGIIPPEEWEHNKTLQNNNGQTVAMILASNGVIPTKHWDHKADL